MTYNIQIAAFDDNLFRDDRRWRILETIENNEPDFIGFQEAYSAHDQPQQDQLEEIFDGTKWTLFRWDDQDENNKKMLAHGIARATEILEAAGAKKTIPATDVLRHAGWHLMGTARMGDDPEKSVVNAWGRCHDVKNLFIIDGSIFVTAGAVNCTPTIQALALYIGDSIKKNLNNLFD